MVDTPHVENADEMVRRATDVSNLIDLCKEYFEISIGARPPTEAEKEEALPNLMGAFDESDPTPEQRVKAMKYPLASAPQIIRMFLAHEYIVYQILADRTNVIDGPYIPMLRYETRMQDELYEERRYKEAIIRQSSLFQTYGRMKTGMSSLDVPSFIEHHGDSITPPRVSAGTNSRIGDVYEFRCSIGHNWRVYIEPSTNQSQLRVYAKGRRVIEELLNAELDETYESVTSDPAAKRPPVRFENRERATASVNINESVSRSCPDCGEELEEDSNLCSNCGWESES